MFPCLSCDMLVQEELHLIEFTDYSLQKLGMSTRKGMLSPVADCDESEIRAKRGSWDAEAEKK